MMENTVHENLKGLTMNPCKPPCAIFIDRMIAC